MFNIYSGNQHITTCLHYDIICAADLKNTFHTIKVYVNIRPQFFCIALELRSLHCILSFADINLGFTVANICLPSAARHQ
jgi:hypothetical protein